MHTTLINTDDLQEALDNPSWVICDCRYDLMNKTAGREAYQKGHIPGAVYLDLHDDLSGPPVTNHGRHPLPTTEAMNALFSRLGIKSQTQVVVYDDAGGSFAARLWWMLCHMQHEAVAVLDGGWQAWLEEGLPAETAMRKNTPSNSSLQPREGDLVLADTVLEYDCLIDSRDAARYRGEVEPIDKQAGHIPGAINRFWKENLQENGRFKSPQQLSTEWLALLGENTPSETVVYCGSGVTACHNLLAACHAGLQQPKLYAGSWSEWSILSGKPIATGDSSS